MRCKPKKGQIEEKGKRKSVENTERQEDKAQKPRAKEKKKEKGGERRRKKEKEGERRRKRETATKKEKSTACGAMCTLCKEGAN